MGRIIVADLHLDSDPLTEYRWEIFPTLRDYGAINGVTHIDILGDLTEKKDKHDSTLVNRLVFNLEELTFLGMKVRILMGNHDYIDSDEPFFGFLNQMEGIKFIYSMTTIKDTLFLPHTKNFQLPPVESPKYVYLHQPFKGAIAQGGYALQEGTDPNIFNNTKSTIFSGDIHAPQKLGNIEYVGSPYHVYFGDNYQGRMILIQDGKQTSIDFNMFPKRLYKTIQSLEDLQAIDCKKDDQIKIKVQLDKDKYFLWDTWKKEVKDFCTKKDVTLVSLELKPNKTIEELQQDEQFYRIKEEPKNVIERFSNNEKLTDEFVEVAYGVVDEVKKDKNKRV